MELSDMPMTLDGTTLKDWAKLLRPSYSKTESGERRFESTSCGLIILMTSSTP